MEDAKIYSEIKCINKLLNCCHNLKKIYIPEKNLRNQIDTIINILNKPTFTLSKNCYIYLKWSIDDICEKATDYIQYVKNNRDALNKNVLYKHTHELSIHFFNIIDKQMGDIVIADERYYNTSKFYEDELTNLKKELEDQKILLQEKEKQDKKESELKTLRKTIDGLTDKITSLTIEKEELRKQEDKKEKLQNEINEVFENLKKYTQPIIDERDRLKTLYDTYKFAIYILFIILLWYELHAISYWRGLLVKNIISYIPLYLPIPLFGTLFGVCIYQMNRAQRQLLLIAHQLHHITYIEGLLSALSSLSTDITEGANKVRSVIEQLINNYLKQNIESVESKIDLTLEKDKVYDLDKTLGYLHKMKDLIISKV